MKRAVAILLCLLLPAMLPAHTNLSSSAPEDGASVAAPTEIRLEFSAPVRLTAVSLRSAAGSDIPLGDISSEVQTSFSVAIETAMEPGQYQVSWRSISGDSHVVSGEIRFTVVD